MGNSSSSSVHIYVYVVSIALVSFSAFVWYGQTSVPVVENAIISSPQAPITTNLTVKNLTPKLEQKTEKKGDDKSKKFDLKDAKRTIQKVDREEKNMVVMDVNNTIQVIQEGNEVLVFEANNVSSAKLADEDTVIYQAQGGETPGVYVQDIGSDNPILVIETTDWSAVDNTLMVDEDTIFFNQPKTGKIGTKDIGGEEKIWDQKLSKSASSYITLTAFKFPTQSPDGKYIAMYDLNPDNPQNPFEAEVRVYDMGGNIYMSARVQLAPRGMSAWEKPLEWVESYLIAGDEKVVFDVEKKSEIYRAEKPVHLKISPDKSKMIQIDQENGDAGVYTIEGKKMFDIEKNVRQAEWIDNNTIMLTIADSIYIYDTNTQKLEKATDSTGFFQIHDVDTNSVIVTNDDQLMSFELSN